jgi:transcription termination factor NusB
MATEKQIAANRANASKSTGPKSAQGKGAVRRNALQHGLLARESMLPGEEPHELEALGRRLRDQLQPEGELEELLVDQMLASVWKLRRLNQVESGVFAYQLYEIRSTKSAERARTRRSKGGGNKNPTGS